MNGFIDEYLGLDELLDVDDTVRLLVRMVILLVVVSIVLRSYVRRYHSTEHVFTYWAFAIVTFSIGFLLRKVPMELGFALGLFAVFGVLRYRTESIAIKDLSYLFIVIGLALINALSNTKVSVVELFIVNGAIAGTVWVRENKRLTRHESSVIILYDQIPMLAPQHRDALKADLTVRTGLPVTRFDVQQVDLLRDTAQIVVHFDVGTTVKQVFPQPAASKSAGQPIDIAAEHPESNPPQGLAPDAVRT